MGSPPYGLLEAGWDALLALAKQTAGGDQPDEQAGAQKNQGGGSWNSRWGRGAAATTDSATTVSAGTLGDPIDLADAARQLKNAEEDGVVIRRIRRRDSDLRLTLTQEGGDSV